MIVMAVHQCPRCPLRFSFRTELEFHLREDHDRGRDAEATGDARERAASRSPTEATGSRPDELVAASATALMVSPVSSVLPTQGSLSSLPWPDLGLAVYTPEGKARGGAHGIDRPLPPVTRMSRWMKMVVIALVVIVLGLGLLFG